MAAARLSKHCAHQLSNDWRKRLAWRKRPGGLGVAVESNIGAAYQRGIMHIWQ